MKKYFPLILFILAFSGLIAFQAGWRLINNQPHSAENSENPEYLEYENLFLQGNFQTIDGKRIEISKVKAPVIVYNFWASWCVPCIEEIPSLIAFKKKFTDDELQVFAFNTDQDDQLKNINKTKNKLQIGDEINIVADVNTVIAESFKITSLPLTIIFNRGKVVFFNNGPVDFSSLEMIEKTKSWLK